MTTTLNSLSQIHSIVYLAVYPQLALTTCQILEFCVCFILSNRYTPHEAQTYYTQVKSHMLHQLSQPDTTRSWRSFDGFEVITAQLFLVRKHGYNSFHAGIAKPAFLACFFYFFLFHCIHKENNYGGRKAQRFQMQAQKSDCCAIVYQ